MSMSALFTDPNDDAKMFDLAPVSLWIEDYSDVKALFEQWQKARAVLPAYRSNLLEYG